MQLNASDLARLRDTAREALYDLQNLANNDRRIAEDTKRNLEAHLAKFDDLNSTLMREQARRELAEAEIGGRIIRLDAEMRRKMQARGLAHDVTTLRKKALSRYETTPDYRALMRSRDEYGAFFRFLKSGEMPDVKGAASFGFAPELKTLRTDSETQGSYLIPRILDNEVRRNIVEISPVRLYARTRVAPGKSVDIPRRLAVLTAAFEGEGETDERDVSLYGSESVTLYRQSVTVPATLDMMVSAAIDLEREIATDVGEAFGSGEGRAFLLGDGVKGPQGIISDPRVEVVDTAGVGSLTFEDIAELISRLKRGQRPVLFMNRRTLSKLWQIKSTIGVPIWQPAAGAGAAAIWGEPYSADFNDLDDSGSSGAKPILFADMRRGYEIFDGVGISVIRDDFSRKREAITEWTFRRYLTGRVIIPEAFKVLRIKA